MTEARIKEIAEKFGTGWYPHEIDAMGAVANEGRKGGIEEMRKEVQKLMPMPSKMIDKIAEWLKEQG